MFESEDGTVTFVEYKSLGKWKEIETKFTREQLKMMPKQFISYAKSLNIFIRSLGIAGVEAILPEEDK